MHETVLSQDEILEEIVEHIAEESVDELDRRSEEGASHYQEMMAMLTGGSRPPLSQEEEAELLARRDAGDSSAMHALVCSQLKYLIHLSRECARSYRGEVDEEFLQDLVQEGAIGLIQAVKRYDPGIAKESGTTLTTYCRSWIKKYVMLAMRDQGKTIALPDDVIRSITLIRTKKNELRDLLCREPADEEICFALEGSIPLAEIRELIKWDSYQKTVGLTWDENRDDENDPTQLISEEDSDPELLLESKDLLAAVRNAMDELPEVDQLIIKMTFGIDGEHKSNARQIIKAMKERLPGCAGMTPAAVSQRKAKALQKLKERLGAYV